MGLENLLSGIIGAVVAVILAEFIKYGYRYWSRRRYRQILRQYILSFIVPGIRKYIDDTDAASEAVKQYPDTRLTPAFDSLPSLNSTILKEIDFKELYFLAGNYTNHSILIDIYHCIDFLKETMPSQFCEDFRAACIKHFDQKKIEGIDQIIEHCKRCPTVTELKAVTITNLNKKKSTAQAVQQLTNSLLEGL